MQMKKLLILSVLVLAFLSVKGQESIDEPPPVSQRLFFGGNFNLQIGTYTNIEVAPIVGFWVLPRLAIAVGPSYIYTKDPYFGATNIFGGRAYAEFLVFRDLDQFIPVGIHTGLLLHAEDEALNMNPYEYGTSATDIGRTTVNTFLAGLGISQQLGNRASVNLLVLWALDNSTYYTYSNPVIRIGFQF
jgi:hypothetical protein